MYVHTYLSKMNVQITGELKYVFVFVFCYDFLFLGKFAYALIVVDNRQ